MPPHSPRTMLPVFIVLQNMPPVSMLMNIVNIVRGEGGAISDTTNVACRYFLKIAILTSECEQFCPGLSVYVFL